ncbi:hypothetical protein LTR28_007307, partial [Elasticomyces elasticus]
MDSRSIQHPHRPSSDLRPTSIPLISLSRTPSPAAYSRNRSGAQSEDEDDLDYASPRSQSRPLVAADVGPGGSVWKRVFRQGGLGRWLWQTRAGRDVYVGLLVFWIGGWQYELLLLN